MSRGIMPSWQSFLMSLISHFLKSRPTADLWIQGNALVCPHAEDTQDKAEP